MPEEIARELREGRLTDVSYGKRSLLVEHQREGQRQALLSFAASSRDRHSAAVVAFLDALLDARDAAAGLRALNDEIADALDEADGLRRDYSDSNPLPIPARHLELARVWDADFLGDRFNRSRLERFLADAAQEGWRPSRRSAKDGRN